MTGINPRLELSGQKAVEALESGHDRVPHASGLRSSHLSHQRIGDNKLPFSIS